jgi:hypothetical protein
MRRMLLLAALLLPSAARAQSPDHDAAYAVVTKLFDGMRTRDTTAMRASFVESATLQSVSATGIRTDAINAWIGSVAGAPAGLVLDERLANPVVQVNGDLASVWVDYWFFAGERFSHCGVDAFVLARQGGTWKIISVADTRRREGCAPAPAK